MEDNVVSLVHRKKIKYLAENIKELDEVSKILKTSIHSLTTYEKYASVKRRIEDLFILYQDIKRAKQAKLDTLQRLKNET
jgi:inorganic pyrophosphatase